MAKRRSRRRGNEISMGYRIHALPDGGVPRPVVYRTLLDAIAAGDGELPADWDVEWTWRNHPEQPLRSAPFDQAVRESRGGFLNLMIGRLERDSGLTADVREATEAEQRRLFEDEDEAEREKPGEATRRRRERQRIARSQAAVKGWATRRRHQAAARRAARRRSAAAKRGWETRRRNARRQRRRRRR